MDLEGWMENKSSTWNQLMNRWIDEDGTNYQIRFDCAERLMLGFMGVTMFLSMWVSNTGSTAMIVPIVEALISELYQVSWFIRWFVLAASTNSLRVAEQWRQ